MKIDELKQLIGNRIKEIIEADRADGLRRRSKPRAQQDQLGRHGHPTKPINLED